jgi:hypothetical protein
MIHDAERMADATEANNLRRQTGWQTEEISLQSVPSGFLLARFALIRRRQQLDIKLA